MRNKLLLNRGLEFAAKGALAEAEQEFRQAIKERPDNPEAYNCLGAIQYRARQTKAAESSFRYAIKLKADFSEAYNNLSILLKDTNRADEAIKYLYNAIMLNPNFAEAYNSLGTILTDANSIETAENCFYRAIEIKADYPDPYHNLGILFTNTNRLSQAETYFCQALKLNPTYAEAEFSLATLYLLQAQFEKGWDKYDKSRMIRYNSAQPDIPCWAGEELSGRKILLYHEQGFGDTLHFVRYTHMVAQLAARTVLWVQKPLQRLTASSFPLLEVHGSDGVPPGNFDFSCPLPSLPRIFNTSAQTIPQIIPYIKPCPEVTAKWTRVVEQLPVHHCYKAGVVWAGNPNHHNDRNRSIPIGLFAELFTVKEVTWFCLQVGSQGFPMFPNSGNLFAFSEELVDFAETAGLIQQLDLVITVDSAVAHLAGAMGKRTWLLLPFAPDWRWQIKREDSPWYPTMRLFRQRRAGDWREVLARVQDALRKEYVRDS